MSIKYFPWQKKVWTQLADMRERLPHAMLIHGRPGIGKRHLAEVLAQSLLCEDRRDEGLACGVCPACAWFVSGNHPDTLPRFLETNKSNWLAWISRPAPAKMKLYWTGGCAKGYAEGIGVLKQEFVFFRENGLIKYEGTMIDGKYSGVGELVWVGKRIAKGQKYIGSFADGDLDGKGEIRFPDGRRYSGYWKNGRYEGSGVYSSPTFGRFEGIFARGLPNGYGKHFDPKGHLRMEGVFRDGCLKSGDSWVFVLTTREKCGF